MEQQINDQHPVLADVQDLLLETPDVEDFLAELARHSAGRLSDSSGPVFCGITLLRHRRAATVAYSDHHALLLDELQYQFKEGPCLTCCKEQVLVHIPDLERDNTWPEYNQVARQQGVRSILAVPFAMPESTARAGLNLYCERPRGFDQLAVQRATEYVEQASKGLRLAVLIAQHSQTAADLRAAMESRTIIDMAVGIIIAQNRCSQADALELIKRASSNRNVKLRDVAASIVESAGGGSVSTHFT